MEESNGLENGNHEGWPTMTCDEALHRRNMERHVEKLSSNIELMLSKQRDWEENQRWQINQMRQTLSSLHRDVSFGLLLLLMLLGYIIYKHYW